MNRIVITGVGIISPVGIGRDEFWHNLSGGVSGIKYITLFDVSNFPVRIGGEVCDFEPDMLMEEYPQSQKMRDRKVLLGLAAAQEAIADAGLEGDDLDQALLWVGVGLEAFDLGDLTPYAEASNTNEVLQVSRMDVETNGLLQTPLNSTTQILGDSYGFMAGRYTNCSACAAGAQVIGLAWQMLQAGQANVALAGATDSMLNPLGLGGFSILKVLSNENDQPERACRPFDATRKGTVLGEGSGFMILEEVNHACERGARIYGEVLGYGSSMDAFRVSDPEPMGKGAVQSMKLALHSAGLQPEDIDCVNAHGTGTPKNDKVETKAIKEILGQRAYDIPVHSVKSMTGHMIAASGSVEAISSVLTIANGTVPPTINLEKPDDQCDLDYVADGKREFDGEIVMSNSFGFGGQNATLIFGRYGR